MIGIQQTYNTLTSVLKMFTPLHPNFQQVLWADSTILVSEYLFLHIFSAIRITKSVCLILSLRSQPTLLLQMKISFSLSHTHICMNLMVLNVGFFVHFNVNFTALMLVFAWCWDKILNQCLLSLLNIDSFTLI